ncbi:long-chain fatty acid--CoA ligase [Actibacterium sp. MT2.3-13A]|uniref:AMP-dependent synthetase/ligase n=1 Tax=Actibacterium sp. MT2.3-13A TaxID=2828332 RepID=UPI001BAC93F1|nr:long-chain fatty acid--CoA ligase [Actibacterium sp. MT2.3-13A]
MQTASPPDIDLIGCAEARTIPGLFFRRAARDPERVAYAGFRDGRWVEFTWGQIARRVARLRAALDDAGLRVGERVALWLPNGPDWVAFDIAAAANGLITVPLYFHDSPENAGFILAGAGARLCVVESGAQWRALAPHLSGCDALGDVWLRAGGEDAAPGRAPRVSALSAVLGEGEVSPDDIRCGPQDIATIIYTSGTTGRPKGAMLSHHALLWNAEAVTRFVPPLKSDVFLSLLPLAHAFERTMGYHLAMMGGARVAYARGLDCLREDMLTVRPTVLIAVPRLYERLYEAILQTAAVNPVKRRLAAAAADLGWRIFEAGQGRGARPGPVARHLLWPLLERLVARPVQAAFGGRLRVAVSGGAQLSTEVSRFLIGLGVPLIEGYGLTEAAPVVTAASFEDNAPGSVGRPLHGVALRLDAQGELQVRTPAMMAGYWNDPQQTAAAITGDGWLRTGDIAEIRQGRVYIRGRLKEVIVLSTAKKVAPVEVEAAIERVPLVDQACVVGNGRASLVAIVVLNASAWAELAAETGLDPRDPNHPAAAGAILARIAPATAGLAPHARVRGVHVAPAPWTVGDGTLTPTLKIRRQEIEARHRPEIDALYERLAARRNGAGRHRAPAPGG